MGKLSKTKKILDVSYFMYKVCEGCENVLYYDIPVCPKCKTYRFSESKTAIIKAFKKMLKEVDMF
jgi:hypothetical protein